MWESGHWLWLCICGPPGLPAASIWALPELAISCKGGRHSARLAQDWLPVNLLIWALWPFFSVFLTFPLPEVFYLCKDRVPRQGWWHVFNFPFSIEPPWLLRSLLRQTEGMKARTTSGLKYKTTLPGPWMWNEEYLGLYSVNTSFIMDHWKLIVLEGKR